jgi:hypothetical protein
MQPTVTEKKATLSPLPQDYVLEPYSDEKLAEVDAIRVRRKLPPLTNEQIAERRRTGKDPILK